jgi:hypothetical protein
MLKITCTALLLPAPTIGSYRDKFNHMSRGQLLATETKPLPHILFATLDFESQPQGSRPNSILGFPLIRDPVRHSFFRTPHSWNFDYNLPIN